MTDLQPSATRTLDAQPCRVDEPCMSCIGQVDADRAEPPHLGLLHTRDQEEEYGGVLLKMEHYECMQCPACWLRPPLPGLRWRMLEAKHR